MRRLKALAHRLRTLARMQLNSPDFAPQGTIPQRCTCEGDETAPALCWTGVPEQAKSLALIVDDPDAPDPDAPRRTWVHWVLYDIPRTAIGLPEGGRPLPEGTREGTNDWNRTGWGGPCPPVGRHRYFFKLYALDCLLPALPNATKAAVEEAMHGHVLAQAQMIGTYCKHSA